MRHVELVRLCPVVGHQQPSGKARRNQMRMRTDGPSVRAASSPRRDSVSCRVAARDSCRVRGEQVPQSPPEGLTVSACFQPIGHLFLLRFIDVRCYGNDRATRRPARVRHSGFPRFHHLCRHYPAVELFGAHVAERQRGRAQAGAIGVCAPGNAGSLFVADMRRQCSDQHQ